MNQSRVTITSDIRDYCEWVLRAWSVLILSALMCIHLVLLYGFCIDAKTIDEFLSPFLPFVGGALVLYSINTNIGMFRKGHNLKTIFFDYLGEFPAIRKSAGVPSQGAARLVMKTGRSLGYSPRNPEGVDEILEYHEERIKDLEGWRDYILDRAIDEKIKRAKDRILEGQLKFESKMEEVSIGGIQHQLLGIFLVIYGPISRILLGVED